MGALLVLALLGAGVPQVVDRQATIFVADVSASVRDARPLASDFINQALGAKRADDAYASATTRWGFYLLSLKRYLETGKGAPNPEDTELIR